VGQFGRDFAGKTVYFGAGPCADPQIIGIEEEDGLRVEIRSAGEEATLRLPMLGRHNASNAAAAVAVGREAGVGLAEAIAALETLTPGERRGEILSLGGATVINDSYNSNPEALKSMIAALGARVALRRILVAGEMLELGEHAAGMHAECGEAAAALGIDVVVGVRGNARYLVDAAAELGVRGVFLEDAGAAGEWLVRNLRPGDAVLVKGSRGVRLEVAIAALRKELKG